MSPMELRGPELEAVVSPSGAELRSLRLHGREVLWQAGPEWPRHARVLFPVIGRVEDDQVLVDGRSHPMGKHGFARDLAFGVSSCTGTRAELRLESSAATLERYPFAFELVVTYDVSGAGLQVTFTVRNTGARALPFALGWHPAFRWPRTPDSERAGHRLELQAAEPGPVRRVTDVLLRPERYPTPVRERQLHLTEEPFHDGALILEEVRSAALVYRGPDGRGLEMTWDGFRHVAVWAPIDADLLCLEPWTGLPSPMDWRDELSAMPGLQVLPPAETFTATVTVGSAARRASTTTQPARAQVY